MTWKTGIYNINIDDFRNGTLSIQQGDRGPGVEILEQLLEAIDPSFYLGPPDDIFGKGVLKGVLRFQQARLLEETGIVDSTTRRALVDAWQVDWRPGQPFKIKIGNSDISTYGVHHPVVGELPEAVLGQVEGGRMSTFGGPRDKGDRIYGQAYLSGAPSPRAFIKKHTKLVGMGVILSKSEASKIDYFQGNLEHWPLTTDWRGRKKHAGPSALLNPNGHYCALRWRRGQRKATYNDKSPRILVWNPKNGKATVNLATDYGPHPSTHRYIDVSPGTARDLDLRTDDYCCVAYAVDSAMPGLV